MSIFQKFSINQKGFAPILIVLGIVATLGIAGGAYYLGTNKAPSQPQQVNTSQTPQPSQIPSPTSDETANWKTYTNTKYGYEIQYPQDKFIDCSHGDYFALDFNYNALNETSCADGEGFRDISITAVDKSYGTTATTKFPECWSTKQEQVNVGSVVGTKYTNTRSNKDSCNTTQIAYARQNHILVDLNGVTLRIFLSEFGAYGNDQVKIVQIAEQVLSTFKFLDSSDETTNWKTYKSTYANISFKYPYSWKISDKLYEDVATARSQTIEITDEKDNLQLYLTRPDYADGCDGPQEQKEIVLEVGKVNQTMKKVCGFYLGQIREFYIMAFFIGTPNENIGKELLKTIE